MPSPAIRAIVGNEAEDLFIPTILLDKTSESFRIRIQTQEHFNDTILNLLDTSPDIFEVFLLNADNPTITRTAACNKLTRCPVCGRSTVDWCELHLIELCVFAFETGIDDFIDRACFELTRFYSPLRLPSQATLEAAKSKNEAIYLLLLSYWIHEMDDSGIDEAIKCLDGAVLDDTYLWRDRIGDKSYIDTELEDAGKLLRTMYYTLAGRWERWREETCAHQKRT